MYNTNISIGESVISYLNNQATNKMNQTNSQHGKSTKRTYGESLTSDEVFNRIIEKEQVEKKRMKTQNQKEKKKLLIN